MTNQEIDDIARELAFEIVEHDSDEVGDPDKLADIIYLKLIELLQCKE